MQWKELIPICPKLNTFIIWAWFIIIMNWFAFQATIIYTTTEWIGSLTKNTENLYAIDVLA